MRRLTHSDRFANEDFQLIEEELPLHQQSFQSFHTANYRGNTPGHDQQFRSDSNHPTQHYGSSQVTSQYRGQQRAYQPVGYVQSAYGQQNRNQSYGQASSYSSFNPSQNMPTQSQYIPAQSHYASSYSPISSSYGMASSQQQHQFASPQSFHTANYRGNQQGHDAYLRSDSSQPSGFGTSVAQSVNAFNTLQQSNTFGRF